MSLTADERDPANLWDIRQALIHVRSMIDGVSRADFVPDSQICLAMERGAQIVGRAAARLSPEFRETHAEVDWARLISHSDELTENYRNIDVDRLRQFAFEDAERLEVAVDAMLRLFHEPADAPN